MLENILKIVIEQLLKLLPEEKVKEAADKILDKVENYIDESGNKIDDAVLLPVLKLIRDTFGIDDND